MIKMATKLKIFHVSMPEDLVALLNDVKSKRGDLSMSNTIRFLCLKGLAVMSYLPDEQKKALEVQS